MKERDIEPLGVDLYTPDFVDLARGFGCQGRRLASIDELPALISEALTQRGPTLIEVPEGSVTRTP